MLSVSQKARPHSAPEPQSDSSDNAQSKGELAESQSVSLSVQLPGLFVVEHEFDVPLRHGDPDGERIRVFVREVSAPDGRDRPFLLFLQGGPGMEASRPTAHPYSPGWLERALKDFRVLLLDQRGTGRSSPIGALEGMGPEEQARHLACFRADSIVKDAELVRAEMGVERWSVLGQSFGGFCVLHYLSAAPEGLAEAFLTGGLPPLGRHPDEVYRATYARTIDRCRRYYERYPADRERVRRLHAWMSEQEVVLPGGDRLTGRMFRQLGWMLGMSDGAEHLHYILELPESSPAFLRDVETGLPPFSRNPLYAVVHESSYSDGVVTDWSSARVQPKAYEANVELFTGEHVFPWMFEDYGSLRPLKEAADILARWEWPRMYDPERLSQCEVPAAAAIYANDMYVERSFSEETAAGIPTMRTWLTDEFEHNGLRAEGGRILDRLIALARGL
jgi:pimeloyl-ACP methyl ester carboxylesterase